jgi:type VI secretion system protein ImpL
MIPLVKRFHEDEWVWGTSVSAASWPRLTTQLTAIYERDYTRAWDDLLADLEIVPFTTVQQYADALGIMVGPRSPLRGVLKVAADSTAIVAPPGSTPTAPSSVGSRIAESARDLFGSAQQRATGATTAPPGTAITEHFQPLQKVMAGAPAPIDGIFEQIRRIRDQLMKLGPQVGGSQPLKVLSDPTLRDMRRALEQDAAQLPPPINNLIAQIAQHAGTAVSADATSELQQRYRDEVVAQCRVRLQSRYPFALASASDIPLSDFGDVFGYGGLFDKFFTDNLAALVDTSQRPWTWRPGSVESAPGMLAQFERAERIRQMFFNPGLKTPELEFTVRLSGLDVAATRFYLEINDQRFEVQPGAESRGQVVWPGPAKRSFAVAVFEDRVGAPDRAVAFDLPWAWFRLVDATRTPSVEARPGDLESTLRLQTKYHAARVIIEAANPVRNPFTSLDWRQFRCEP